MVESPASEYFLCSHTCSTVRNRSKELVELLADVDKIRRERKEAKANRSKYVGTGNDGFSGGGRYGGFGNDSLSGGGSYSGDYGTHASGFERGEFLYTIGGTAINSKRRLREREQQRISG